MFDKIYLTKLICYCYDAGIMVGKTDRDFRDEQDFDYEANPYIDLVAAFRDPEFTSLSDIAEEYGFLFGTNPSAIETFQTGQTGLNGALDARRRELVKALARSLGSDSPDFDFDLSTLTREQIAGFKLSDPEAPDPRTMFIDRMYMSLGIIDNAPTIASLKDGSGTIDTVTRLGLPNRPGVEFVIKFDGRTHRLVSRPQAPKAS